MELQKTEYSDSIGKRPEPFTRKEETLINSSPCKTLINNN
jgi:hypothetical protein